MNPITSTQNLNSTVPIDTIVVPQGAEYQAVYRGLPKSCLDKIQIITISMGTENVPQVLASYARQLSQAQKVLIIGLCGSLSHLYNVGDAILVKSCQDLADNQIDLDLELTSKIQDIISVDIVAGLTSDRIITQAREKQQLALQHSLSIVEMEGYGYVKDLQQQGLAVAMIRVVSDGLQGDIPDLSNAIDHQGKIKTMAMAISFIKQPLAALRLIRGSLTGLKVLEKVTAKLFDSKLTTNY